MNNIIENINFDRCYNYQLIKNDVIDIESDRRITFYSVLVNVIENNTVKKSAYVCDVAREVKTAKYVFFEIAYGRVPCELIQEATEELLL